MATVELTQIKKIYDNKTIIPELNLSIKEGEFLVIVGPSGCGKSSLLRMIAGLEPVTHGTISIDNKIVNHLEPKHRNIAMVFQNYALYPHMSVYDNMSYALRLSGMGKGEIAKRVARIADILELTQVLDRHPHELSGGQRQRVAMGRAIIRKPRIFLFDEPLSNLDAKLRVQMRLEIKKLQRELNITSIYVTHDQIEAMTLADRLVVMNKGSILQMGTPLEIYNNPASIFTGSFIGSPPMNFINANIVTNGIFINEASIYQGNTVFQKQGKVILGFRPEMCFIQQGSSSRDLISLPIQIEMIESLGADVLVHGFLENSEHLLTARLSSRQGLKENDRLMLGLPIEFIHIFDPESKMRLNDSMF